MPVERVGCGRAFDHKQAIKKAERRLQETYSALGIRAYNLVKAGAVTTADLVEVSGEIDAVLVEIEQHKEALEAIRMQKEAARGTRCPYCGMMAAPGAKFCPGCGQRVDLPVGSTEAAINLVQCPYCGASISAGASFCGVCGTKISQEALAAASAPPAAAPEGPSPVPASPVPAPPPGAPGRSAGNATAALAQPVPQSPPPQPAGPPGVIPGPPPGATGAAVTASATGSAGKCAYCGEQLPSDATFCVNCGKSV